MQIVSFTLNTHFFVKFFFSFQLKPAKESERCGKKIKINVLKFYIETFDYRVRGCLGFFVILVLVGPICFLAINKYLKMDDEEKIKCFVDHIRSEGEECFSSVGEYHGDISECEQDIENSVYNYLEHKKPALNAIILTDLDKVSNCVFSQLKLHEYFINTVLLSETLKHTKISWAFWRYFERKIRLSEVEQQLDRIEKQAIENCKGNTETSDEVEYDDSSEFKVISTTEIPTTTTKSRYIFDRTTPAQRNDEGSADGNDDDEPPSTTKKVNENLHNEGSGDDDSDEELPQNIKSLNEGSGDDEYDEEYGSKRRRREISPKHRLILKDDDFVFQN